MDKEIIEKLTKSLKPYLTSLESNLNLVAKPFDSLEIESLSKTGFTYDAAERGLNFLDGLRNFFNRDNINDDEYIVKFWIINKWGGISSFKDNKEKAINSNRQKINGFLDRIGQRKKLTKNLFEVVSSLSKVASFSNSLDFFVYDSRVIYCLNWLILKNNITQLKFFPMPQGRNSKLSFFDLDTIIKLKKKKEYKDLNISSLYFSHEDVYYIYCELIKELARELIPEKPTYYIELFLFSLVDTIYEEIRESAEITFKE